MSSERLKDAPPGGAQAARLAVRASRGRRASWIWVAALTVAWLGQSLPRLTAVPRAIMDESWEALTGYALAYEGRLRNPVILDRNGIDRAFVQPRVTQSLVLAAAYRLGGFSLATGRLASVLFGLVGVWGVYYLTRVWLSPTLAVLIALLTAVELHVFLAARTVRPEAYVFAASVWVLALLARGTTGPSGLPCAGAGLIGAVGCYTHPNVLILVLLGAVLILYQTTPRRRVASCLAGYVAGGLVGLAPFLLYVAYAHACYDVHFFEQLGGFYTEVGGDSAATLVSREVCRWRAYLLPVHRAPYVSAVAAALAVGLWRRHPIQVWAVLIVGGYAAILPAINRSSAPRYLLVLSPWLAALVVLCAAQLWAWAQSRWSGGWRRRLTQAVAAGGIALCLAVNVVGNAYVLHAHRNADYEAVCRRIAQHIPAGARVCGPLVFWTGLHSYPYLSDINEEAGSESSVHVQTQARLVRFGPQYVVCSSDACWSLRGTGPRNREAVYDMDDANDRFRRVRDGVVEEYIARRGVLLERFTTYDFGTIEIYWIRP